MKLPLQKIKDVIKNKKIIFLSSFAVVAAIIVILLLFVRLPKSGGENVLPIRISSEGGSLDVGNTVLTSAVDKKSGEYSSVTALSSFVGTLYSVGWKSGLNSMTRKPMSFFIPIPSNYYLGNTTANLEAVEVVNGLPYTLYGGQVRTLDNLHYLEVLSYFPGKVALKLGTFSSSYGLLPLNKVSNGEANLVVVPGSNVNFSGNVPGTAQNFWVRNFDSYNVYLFSYPITSPRDLTYTSNMLDYFKSSGVDSYTQYTGYLLSNLLDRKSNV